MPPANRSRSAAVFLRAAVCAAAVLLAGCREKAPELVSIDPRIGKTGDVLTIRGSGFGNERDESYVTIAGTPPTISSYLSWNDTEITVRVPEFGEAGLIYVHRGRNKSNPVLFANQASMPEPISEDSGIIPRISAVEPASGPIGTLVTIQGNNFGLSRGGSGVFFSWDAEASPAIPRDIEAPEFVEAFDAEFAYELWSEREIRVRVPDGAISGNLELRTPRGNSRPAFFEITGRPGTKTFRDKRSYIVSYMVDLNIEQAVSPNALYIWMPRPALSASQRNVRLHSRNAEPFVENYRGASLFQFIDNQPGTSRIISVSYIADVYAVETSVRSQAPVTLNTPPPVQTIYTLPSSLVPAAAPEIKALAAQITGRERLPYAKARRIYDWLVTQGGIGEAPVPGGVLDALAEKRADSYQAALLFCALARASDIPALPAAGILVNRQRNTSRHYWAEFWLDGFGWIPLDPALGAGAAPADFNLREDHAQYYFGNMDNQRVSFSRGEPAFSQMTPRGRVASRTRDYSLQNLWEEAAEGLESYSSLWSDITITGMYIQ